MNKGLIKKEYYNLRINLLVCVTFLTCFFLISLFKKYGEEGDSLPAIFTVFLNSLSYVGIGLAYSLTILISSFASDEQSRWNTFLISQGIKRKDILKTKYLISFITTLLVALFSLFTFIPLLKFYSFLDSLYYVLAIFISILGGGILGSVFYTLFLLIFGVSKGSLFVIIGIVLEAVPLGSFFLLTMMFNSSFVNLPLYLLPIFTLIDFLIVLLISFLLYKLTLHLFNKKEF